MSRVNSVEAPHYTWGGGGYHINNGAASSDFLATSVIPSLASRLTEGSVVADFGCGDGRFARVAVGLGASFVIQGYELNPAAVNEFNGEFVYTPHRAEVADLTRLDAGRDRFHSGLFWRVLHSIPSNHHELVMRQIAYALRPGATLHMAVRSERDWVAVDLRRRGLYVPGGMNECYESMAKVLEPLGISSWQLHFFQAGELVRLGKRVGLMVVYQEPIQEPSGYEVLRESHPLLEYDYVELRKPEQG